MITPELKNSVMARENKTLRGEEGYEDVWGFLHVVRSEE